MDPQILGWFQFSSLSGSQSFEEAASSDLLFLELSIKSAADVAELQDLRYFGVLTPQPEAAVFAFNSDEHTRVFRAHSKIAEKWEKYKIYEN